MERPVFYLNNRAAKITAIIGSLIIIALVAFALIYGDVRGFNNTYLTN